MKRLLKFIIVLLPIIYMSIIWYLSSQPSDGVLDTGLRYDDFIKESLHLIEFAGFYFLLILAFLTRGQITRRLNYLLGAAAITYGFVDEIHQYFVPSRSATVIDLVKDAIGVLTVWFVFNKYYFLNSDSTIGRYIAGFEQYWKPGGSKNNSKAQHKA